MQLDRDALLRLLVERLTEAAAPLSHPLRVAIDGPDAAGKSKLAADLGAALAPRRPVVGVSIDGFHQPRALRTRGGDQDPGGYYRDAYDLAAVVADVLRPLGPEGDLRFRLAIFDFRADQPLPPEWSTAAENAIVLFDGVFLMRPELMPHWDYRLYLHVEPSITLERARRRDLDLFGSEQQLIERYRSRYLPSQALYQRSVRPQEYCDFVIDMTDPVNPVVRSQPD
jgi:uridine kinase